MRAIVKPAAPPLDSSTFGAYAQALGEAVGNYCSFCEKALLFEQGLFHKAHGVLTRDAVLSSADWPDLLLICGDCAQFVVDYNPAGPYFWPDTPAAAEKPYLYRQVDNIPYTVLGSEGEKLVEKTVSAILVSVANDLMDDTTQTGATNTLRLFRLNGGYYDAGAFVLPDSEYVCPSDMRLAQRWDIAVRAGSTGQALARSIPVARVQKSFLQNHLAMIDLSINRSGYLSTWRTVIAFTLNSIDPNLLTALIAFMNPEAPPPPLKRSREAAELEEGLEEAEGEAAVKYLRVSRTLAQVIKVG